MKEPTLGEYPAFIGVDPSLTATGLAVAWPEIGGAAATTFGRAGITLAYRHLADRMSDLSDLATEIETWVSSRRPLVICMEAPAPGSSTVSSSGVMERGWLWCELVSRLGAVCPLFVVTPQQLKIYATGRGIATKGAVIEQVARRMPAFELGGSDNVADAAVLAALAAEIYGTPLYAMPANHRRAVDLIAAGEKQRAGMRERASSRSSRGRLVG